MCVYSQSLAQFTYNVQYEKYQIYIFRPSGGKLKDFNNDIRRNRKQQSQVSWNGKIYSTYRMVKALIPRITKWKPSVSVLEENALHRLYLNQQLLEMSVCGRPKIFHSVLLPTQWIWPYS